MTNRSRYTFMFDFFTKKISDIQEVKEKPVETFVLSYAEASARGLQRPHESFLYCGVASCRGEIAMYEWFCDYVGAVIWTLEKSSYTYV